MSDRGRSRSPKPLSPSPRRGGGGRDRDVSMSRSRSRSFSRSPRRRNGSFSGKDKDEGFKVIVVSGLTKNVHRGHLEEIFGVYGKIQAMDMPLFKVSGLNRGKAAIEFRAPDIAEKAVKHMDGGQLDGSFLSVQASRALVKLKKALTPCRFQNTLCPPPSPLRRLPSPADPDRTPAPVLRPDDEGRRHFRARLLRARDMGTVDVHPPQGADQEDRGDSAVKIDMARQDVVAGVDTEDVEVMAPVRGVGAADTADEEATARPAAPGTSRDRGHPCQSASPETEEHRADVRLIMAHDEAARSRQGLGRIREALAEVEVRLEEGQKAIRDRPRGPFQGVEAGVELRAGQLASRALGWRAEAGAGVRRPKGVEASTQGNKQHSDVRRATGVCCFRRQKSA